MNRDTPWLGVQGNRITDPEGNTVVLRGVSMMNLGDQEREGGILRLIDRMTDRTDSEGAVQGWYPRIIRLPIYPPRVVMDDAPSTDPFPLGEGGAAQERYIDRLIRPAVERAASKGLYAILDFHQIADIDEDTDAQAREFWRAVAPRFTDYPNVLFEVFNEPVRVCGSEAWASIRPFAQAWVDLIRESAPDNLILVAGPVWAQNIRGAVEAPISGGNIVYVSHIYPEHWSLEVADEARGCAARHPVFLSEWGYDNDSPRGRFADVAGYREGLVRLVEETGMSWTAWVLSDNWYPRLLKERLPRCTLTDFGLFTKRWLFERNGAESCPEATQR